MAEKRETQITIGCLEMIIVEKIMELLKRNATITPTLFTLIYSVEGVCVCMHACMYPHVCACVRERERERESKRACTQQGSI